MVQISAAVEHHLLDAFGDGALGDQFANGDRGVAAATRSLEAARSSLSTVEAEQSVLWAASSMTWA